MEEEPRIKINLNDIFQQPSRNVQQEDNSYNNIAQEQPSLQEQLIGIDLQEIKDASHSPTSFAKLNRTIQSNISAETQILNLTKLIKQKEATIKKIEHADADKITAKLFQQKSSICSRSLKKQKSIHCACKKPTVKQQKDNSNEAKNMKTSRSDLSKSEVHERLYNMSKSQYLKMIYMPVKQDKRQNKLHRKSTSSKYLKNYVPFEKRLQEYLNKDHLTASQAILRTEMNFHPKLIPNKYKDRVSSRYMQGQLRDAKTADFADFMNSSVSSSCVSATSKSAQMAQRIQDHFLRKMKLVFVKAPHQIIEVDQSIIGLLTQIEFSILQPFIMQLEENPIKGEDFQSIFQAFYASLTPGEKMQLRNHELKNKSKYRELKKEIKQQKSPKKELFKVIERPYAKHSERHQSKKQTASKSNYHIMIQNFI